MADGLAIDNGVGETRLKWHRLRRQAGDPEFGAHVLQLGFRLGASMEIDLQIRADHGFVVMHDTMLERETTGTGPVRDLDLAHLATLRYQQSGTALLGSEDLARLMSNAHPAALLQFDMKNEWDEIGPQGVAHLAALFAPFVSRLIVSGASLPLIAALGAAMPGIGRGIDPTDRLVDIAGSDGLGAVERQLRDEIRAADTPDMIYLAWELVLEAQAGGLDLIALCHDAGCKVDAWTFNPARPDLGLNAAETDSFVALMALRPDQVTTDHALVMEAAWRELQSVR